MKQIEFETNLDGGTFLNIPPDVAKQLPDHGRATVVVLVEEHEVLTSRKPNASFPDETAWRQASYDAFLKDDSDADRSYDRYL